MGVQGVREKDNGIQTDLLIVKKIGWKRIARNKERFGWVLHKANEHTEITEETSYEGRISGDTLYIDEKVTRTSKTRVWLSFYRIKDNFVNLSSIKLLEIFYNIIFFIRKILAFFMPILFVATLVLLFLNFTDLSIAVGGGFYATTFTWIFCIILEGILSRIAGKILKVKSYVNEK